MPQPPADTNVEVILGTGDTATGSDGAPYAPLRMVLPVVTQILQDLLLQMMTDSTQVRAPMVLLAWIPQATAGLTADN